MSMTNAFAALSWGSVSSAPKAASTPLTPSVRRVVVSGMPSTAPRMAPAAAPSPKTSEKAR
jgi:hypothetical protein